MNIETKDERIKRLEHLLYEMGYCPDCGHKLTKHGLLPMGEMDCPVVENKLTDYNANHTRTEASVQGAFR